MSTEQSFFVMAKAEKCSGCKACELACFAGHLNKKTLTVGNITTPVTPRLFLTRGANSCMPIQCHHCEDAPCLRSCLSNAIERVDGAVVINGQKCIGCRNCALACPFGAVQVYSPEDLPSEADSKNAPKLVYKCDLCKDAKEPACVAACPNEALRLVNPAEEIAKKREGALNAMDVSGNSASSIAAGLGINEGGM
ncbi:MAG: 4Fe-4S dicluster domain-containing protein [Termitinemataceae bacterium]|nr:MAG: 4Fe-4S dicluster domain-containing protein [Termitinemataceae bacterium]